MSIKTNADGAKILCCNGRKCPTVKLLPNDIVEIKDDYGNTTVVSLDQAKLIYPAVQELIRDRFVAPSDAILLNE